VNKNVRHNVSNTIIVDDWDVVEKYLYENRNWFSGVSLLTLSGDKDYNQAPFTSILTAKELVKKYGDAAMFASGLIVDGLNAFNNNLWSACDTLNGLGEKLEYSENEINEILKNLTSKEAWKNLGFKNGTLDILSKTMIKPETEEYKRYLDLNLVGTIHNYALKKDWVRRAKQFAKRYFSSIKEMTYCLKDVHNYHKWIEINRDLKEVDWKQLNIKPKYVDIDTTGAVACSGNSCEIVF
jgi:ribonucleoside-diphosphate reductase alpha chain